MTAITKRPRYRALEMGDDLFLIVDTEAPDDLDNPAVWSLRTLATCDSQDQAEALLELLSLPRLTP